MAINRTRLLALSEREFRTQSEAPQPKPANTKFRALRLNITKFGDGWDRKRGAAARLMAVLLRESDAQLTERVCETSDSSKTYNGAADWLTREARYLRKVASMMDTAAGRLGVALQRCTASDSGKDSQSN